MALSDPEELSGRADKYNYWQEGHQVTKFGRVLRQCEKKFQGIFAGFIVTPDQPVSEWDVDYSETGSSASSSSRFTRVGRPQWGRPAIDPVSQDELERLRLENARLRERLRRLEDEQRENLAEIANLRRQIQRIPEYLVKGRDSEYLRQQQRECGARSTGLRDDVQRLTAIINVFRPRLDGGCDSDAVLLSAEVTRMREDRDAAIAAVRELQDTLDRERGQWKLAMYLPTTDAQLSTENKLLKSMINQLREERDAQTRAAERGRGLDYQVPASYQELKRIQQEIDALRRQLAQQPQAPAEPKEKSNARELRAVNMRLEGQKLELKAAARSSANEAQALCQKCDRNRKKEADLRRQLTEAVPAQKSLQTAVDDSERAADRASSRLAIFEQEKAALEKQIRRADSWSPCREWATKGRDRGTPPEGGGPRGRAAEGS
jgi:hypothetical protein